MVAKRRKAAAPTTAPKNNQPNKDYSISNEQSSEKLKEQLGEVLFYLQTPLGRKQRTVYWNIFENMLREYSGLRNYGVSR